MRRAKQRINESGLLSFLQHLIWYQNDQTSKIQIKRDKEVEDELFPRNVNEKFPP